jgi:hypothetical protein
MKDLTRQDLYRKRNPRLTRLSVFRQGRWSFALPTDVAKIEREATYYKIKLPFGVVFSTQRDPSKVFLRGNPGDYLVVGANGDLSILPKKQYGVFFEPKASKSRVIPKPINSNKLNDPNFLTNIINDGTSRPT